MSKLHSSCTTALSMLICKKELHNKTFTKVECDFPYQFLKGLFSASYVLL